MVGGRVDLMIGLGVEVIIGLEEVTIGLEEVMTGLGVVMIGAMAGPLVELMILGLPVGLTEGRLVGLSVGPMV